MQVVRSFRLLCSPRVPSSLHESSSPLTNLFTCNSPVAEELAAAAAAGNSTVTLMVIYVQTNKRVRACSDYKQIVQRTRVLARWVFILCARTYALAHHLVPPVHLRLFNPPSRCHHKLTRPPLLTSLVFRLSCCNTSLPTRLIRCASTPLK